MNSHDIDFRIGDRVMAGVHTDSWMMGDRYGTVEKIGEKFVHVRMDVSKRCRKFHPSNLEHA
jgi:hypothetical protein